MDNELIQYKERIRQLRKRKCYALGILFSIIGLMLMLFVTGGFGLLLLQIGVAVTVVGIIL